MTTFSDVLGQQLRGESGRPLITFYDDATGERVELSVTTYANWVAKTASLLVEEHDLERGQVLCVDLPTHWLGPVVLGAAWSVGLVVVGPDEPGAPDAVVCGPAGLERWAPSAGSIPVLACALLPLGVRFADPLPPDVHDVGVEVWGQPDAFTAWDPPSPHRLGVRRRRGRHHARGDVEDGRHRESSHRWRPPPLGVEPGFPARDLLLHRATRTRRLSGPGHPPRTGTTRDDVRRRARHGSLPLSAGQPARS